VADDSVQLLFTTRSAAGVGEEWPSAFVFGTNHRHLPQDGTIRLA